MAFQNAYEVLDFLAEKNGMFKMIQEEFAAKDTLIEELSTKVEELTEVIDALIK